MIPRQLSPRNDEGTPRHAVYIPNALVSRTRAVDSAMRGCGKGERLLLFVYIMSL